MKIKIIIILIVFSLIIIKLVLIPRKEIYNNSTIINEKNVQVTAHRGYSELYPENTMEAFEKAFQAYADWIELDVQETKDETIIVAHNPNFKRTANVRKNVWDLTYKEIKKLNVGAYMDKEAYVPTLEEVIAWAKENDVKLNIELKDNGHTKKLIELTLDIIDKYEYLENVVIASMNYQFLIQVKELNPKYKTVYVVRNLNYNGEDYQYADCFSIKNIFLNENLVKEIHKDNKEVYAWTLTSELEILQAINYGVDNIIVNDVELGRQVLK